jgi:TraK protein
MKFIRRIFAAFAAAGLLLPLHCNALQLVDGSDGKTRQVSISNTEMTRLAFEGGRIRSIKYDQAELEVNEDNGVGQIFLKPLVRNKAISIFVITSTDTTHALSLQPTEMGLDSVVIQEPKRERVERLERSSAPKPGVERATAFDTEIRRLITAMARDERTVDYERKVENKEFPLWQGTRFMLMNSWKGRGLRGEWYRLLNDSSQTIRVIEQEFFRPDVAAVAVEIHELLASGHTNVFIVRREGVQ